jgi:hypothetical protein
MEQVIFYLSSLSLDVETRYPKIERLCLCLYFLCTKLRHYLLANEWQYARLMYRNTYYQPGLESKIGKVDASIGRI